LKRLSLVDLAFDVECALRCDARDPEKYNSGSGRPPGAADLEPIARAWLDKFPELKERLGSV
jgi:hypothetical protein